MTEYSFENELISDLHKDARNHRPTSGFMAMWNDLNDDQKQECWDNLISEMNDSQDNQIAEEECGTCCLQDRSCHDYANPYERLEGCIGCDGKTS